MRPIFALALCSLLTACEGEAPSTDKGDVDTSDPCAGSYDAADYSLAWTSVREQDPLGMMMSVFGACQTDVWVVGGQKSGDGFALRGQGSSFTEQALPEGTAMLNWVHGTAEDDLWVGGVGGALLHWTGEDWDDHTLAEDGAIWGVHARSATDALAVGGSFFSVGAPFAYRWDGTDWNPLTLPEEVGSTSILFKAFAYDDGYLVVGLKGLALKVDDSGVSTVSSDAGANDDMVTIHAASGTTPVAVGGFTSGVLWSYDAGDGWTSVATTPAPFLKLNGVHAHENGLVTAVGNQGSSGVWDVDGGTYTEANPFTLDLLHATWVAPNGDSYAVGGNFLTSGDTFHGALGFSPGPN